MLKKGTRVVIAVSQSCDNPYRYISVQSGKNGFNVLNYGISALSNDFKDEVLFRSALEDARTADDVLSAARKYARYNQTIKEVTDY